MSVEVTDNAELSRYEARVGGELAGFAQYRVDGRRMTLVHTEVDPRFEGRGVGSQLAKVALEDVGRQGLDVVPRCPFIAAYVRRHPDLYLGLVPEPLRESVLEGS